MRLLIHPPHPAQPSHLPFPSHPTHKLHPTPNPKHKKTPDKTHSAQKPWYHMQVVLFSMILCALEKERKDPNSNPIAKRNAIPYDAPLIKKKEGRKSAGKSGEMVETPMSQKRRRKCYAVVCAVGEMAGVYCVLLCCVACGKVMAYLAVPWDEGEPRLDGRPAGALVMELRFCAFWISIFFLRVLWRCWISSRTVGC